MDKKKIEPTDAMVDEAANMLSLYATGTSLRYQADGDARPYRNKARTALRVALNHPDTPGLFAFECVDDLRAAREQGWDEAVYWIRRDEGGLSQRTMNARKANPYRPTPILPTEDGAVIVPADGHEYIRTRTGKKSRRLTWDADAFVWYDAHGTHLDTDITPGSWKVDDQ